MSPPHPESLTRMELRAVAGVPPGLVTISGKDFKEEERKWYCPPSLLCTDLLTQQETYPSLLSDQSETIFQTKVKQSSPNARVHFNRTSKASTISLTGACNINALTVSPQSREVLGAFRTRAPLR